MNIDWGAWLPLTAENWQAFHFVRPHFLWLILFALPLAWILKYRQQWQSTWHRYIDAALLMPLLKGKINKPNNTLPVLAFIFWCCAAFALAGPAWLKLPQPVQKLDNAMVILLDLSPSMLAQDIKPARLISARHKIIDLLKARKEGSAALVAYAGDAHIVAPLTDDHETIINLVNVLEPSIMPLSGSNTEDAIRTALELFANAGYQNGDILLVTDGITEQALSNSISLLKNSSFRLSILGVGTAAGAPIPSARGGFIKDNRNNIVMPKLDASLLKELASDTHGYYSPLLLTDADIAPLIGNNGIAARQRADQQKTTTINREFDQWQDMGALLCFPLLILLLFAFRRGIILSIFLALFLSPTFLLSTQQSFADVKSRETEATSSWKFPSWNELWLNKNQQAMKSMKAQKYEQAAQQFSDPNWKASAQYQQGDYQSALKQFEKDTSANGAYNQANALAKSGTLDKAIEAYNNALKQQPDFEDAKFNKELVEKLKQQKKDQQSNSDKSKDEESDSNKDKSNDKQQDDSSSDDNKSGDKTPDSKPSDNNDHKKNDAKKSSKDDSSQEKNKDEPETKENSKSEQDKDGSEKNQAQNESQEPLKDKTPDQQQAADNKPSSEEQQALENWLRKVPDDPSILLRNKFQYYYDQQLRNQRSGDAPSNLNDEQRW